MIKQSTAAVLPIDATLNTLTSAKVMRVTEAGLEINFQGRQIMASRAFSCLVSPLPDDIVAFSLLDDGRYLVHAIIERPGSQALALEFPSDVVVASMAGSVHVRSAQAVNLEAEKLSCTSQEALHISNQAYISYQTTVASGEKLDAKISRITLVSNAIHTLAKQAIQSFKNYIRKTEEFEQTKAGNKRQQVEGLFSVDTNTTLMISENDTKIDGSHIHMG